MFRIREKKIKDESIKKPGDVSLFVYRVLCEMQLENYDEAFELVEYANDLTGGNSAEIYLVRGMLHNKSNNHDKATEDFDKAVSLNPTLGDIVRGML